MVLWTNRADIDGNRSVNRRPCEISDTMVCLDYGEKNIHRGARKTGKRDISLSSHKYVKQKANRGRGIRTEGVGHREIQLSVKPYISGPAHT